MAILHVESPEQNFEVNLGKEQSIGRHPTCMVRLSDPMSSKRHGYIVLKDGKYVFMDAGSANGSFIGGIRVNKHELLDGDEICIGRSVLRFEKRSSQEKMSEMVTMSRSVVFDQFKNKVKIEGTQAFSPESAMADINRLRADYEKLRLGQSLLLDAGLERDLDLVLEKITSELIHIFSGDRCVVLLRDHRNNLVPRFVKTSSDEDEQVHVSETVLQEVMKTRNAILLGGEDDDELMNQAASIVGMGIRSMMCVPLIRKDQLLGAIHMDTKLMERSFDERDLDLLRGIALHVAMAIENTQLVHKAENDARVKYQLERLLSPSLAEQVVKGKINFDKGGDVRNVTMLFCDIRGFTSLSNRQPATKTVSMLNWYFERIVDVVFRHDGTVDKYIGDEVMVLFGAPVPIKDAPDKALCCALAMLEEVQSMNKERENYGEKPIQVGIGINTGEVVAGSIGSTKTMQYTCVGRPVNIASRLTGLAKPNQILLSAMTRKELKGNYTLEDLGPIEIRGEDKKLPCFSATLPA